MTTGRKRVLLAGGAFVVGLGLFAWARSSGSPAASWAPTIGNQPAGLDTLDFSHLPISAAVTTFQPQITPATEPGSAGGGSYIPLFGFIQSGGFGLGGFA